jgi:hypothetical protein
MAYLLDFALLLVIGEGECVHLVVEHVQRTLNQPFLADRVVLAVELKLHE